MSFQIFTQRLAAITATLNAITTNAKRIFELPSQATLDPISLIHVSRDGISESLSVQKIIDTIVEKTYSQLLEVGEITVSGLVVSVPAGARWIYKGINYTTAATTSINETLCAAGYLRKDILVANQLNQIVLIKGTESLTIRVKPNVPIGSVFITDLDVDDTVIGTPSPPVLGDNFISKREKAPFQVYNSGEIDNVVLDEFFYGYLNFRDAVTNLKSIGTYTNAYLYSGRELLIKNSQATDITIYHLTGIGFQFSFPNEVNFILKPNEIIRFSTKILSPTSGILEYVGVVRDKISDVVGLVEALDAIAPDGLVKEGVISMTGLNASIAAEDFEWRINHIIYKNLTLFTDTLPATTTGYMRTDIFEGDDNGDIFRKQGNEAIGVSLKPSVTVGRIELGSIDVENSTAKTPVIPKPKWAVSQQLRDGETGYAPSENVVYDALALKVDKDGSKVLSDNNYTTSEKNKLASIDATHYLPPLQTTVQLSALPQATVSDKARVYVEAELADYFYDTTASSGDIAPDDQIGGVGFWRKVAVGGETAASIKTKYESNADTNAFTNALKAKLDSITEIFTTGLKSNYDSAYTWITTNGAAVLAHISSAHAPSNAQKNSDITKAEIEAKLTGEITTHTHPAVGGGGDMVLASTQTVSGLKTFLSGMFGLRNVANTFTSFFTNANTAARTYTLQNRDGTLADLTDIAGVNSGKMNTPSGTANYMSKFLTATTIGISRLLDTGTFFGIGTVNTPTKDFTFGNQADREIGIEQSDNTIAGKSFRISAGRTINYINNSNFSLIPQIVARLWIHIKGHPNGDTYAVSGGVLYKQINSAGEFVEVTTGITGITGLYITSFSDIYICVGGGYCYKQTNSTGSFVQFGQIGNWNGIAVYNNIDVYAVTGWGVFQPNSYIYKQTGGSGNLIAIDVQRGWSSIDTSVSGVFATNWEGGLYFQNGATGSFNIIRAGNAVYVAIDNANNLYLDEYNGNYNIYKRTNLIGSFDLLFTGNSDLWFRGVGFDINNNVYVASAQQTIWYKQVYAAGSPNLDGGTLKQIAGTGKGTGKSRLEFYTGQKTVSGTNMQVETLREYIDENGYHIYTSMPVYADNAAALTGGLPVGCEYRTSTGVKMIVY